MSQQSMTHEQTVGTIIGAQRLLRAAAVALAAWHGTDNDEDGREYLSGKEEDRQDVEALLPDLRKLAGTGPDGHPGLVIYARDGGIHGGERYSEAPPSRGWVVEVSWCTGDIEYRWFRRQDAARAALLLKAWEHGGIPSASGLSADLSPMGAQFGSSACVWACDSQGRRKR